jgi:hypothetical protein
MSAKTGKKCRGKKNWFAEILKLSSRGTNEEGSQTVTGLNKRKTTKNLKFKKTL